MGTGDLAGDSTDGRQPATPHLEGRDPLAGDLYAFAEQELVDLCPEIDAWARSSRYCGRLCDAEDYAQESLARVLSRLSAIVRGIEKCESRGAARRYLRVCLEREVVSMVRKEASRASHCEHIERDALDGVADPAAAADGQPLASAVDLETQGLVEEALTHLSQVERTILSRTADGVPDAVVAAELNLTEVGVRTHRKRARRKLASCLKLDEDF